MTANLNPDALDKASEKLRNHVRLRGRALFRYDRAVRVVVETYIEEIDRERNTL